MKCSFPGDSLIRSMEEYFLDAMRVSGKVLCAANSGSAVAIADCLDAANDTSCLTKKRQS